MSDLKINNNGLVTEITFYKFQKQVTVTLPPPSKGAWVKIEATGCGVVIEDHATLEQGQTAELVANPMWEIE